MKIKNKEKLEIKIKEVLKQIFIEGFAGMTWGIFATLVIGTIIQQIGNIIGGYAGELLFQFGKIAAGLTGAGIGVGVAVKFKTNQYVTIAAAVAGLIGAFASKILAGNILVEGNLVLAGPGESLGAFLAALAGIEAGRLIAGKTKLDIILVPLITIIVGGIIGLLVGPTISEFMLKLGAVINWAVERQPIVMGILVAVIMGMVLTSPISSTALAIILNLNGLAAGAATIGCCANMIGFAVASFKDNKWGGLFAQGLGTSMLQLPNVMKKPVIWLPAIAASAIIGPFATTIFQMKNNATGAGMGVAGFVSQITTYQTMVTNGNGVEIILKMILLHIILPGIIALIVAEILRKFNIIKKGDMKLDL